MLLTELFADKEDIFEQYLLEVGGLPTGYLRAAITSTDQGEKVYNWIPIFTHSTSDIGVTGKSDHYKLSSNIYSFENPNYPKPASMHINRTTTGGSPRVVSIYRGFQREVANISKDKTIKNMSDGIMKALKSPDTVVTVDGVHHTINRHNANRITMKVVANIVRSKNMDGFKSCYIVWPASSSMLGHNFARLLADGINRVYGGKCTIIGTITNKRTHQDVHNDVETKIPLADRGGKYSVHISDPRDALKKIEAAIDKIAVQIKTTTDIGKKLELQKRQKSLEYRWVYETKKYEETGGGPAKIKSQFNGGRGQLRQHGISLHSFSGDAASIPPRSNILVVDDFRTSGGTLLDVMEMVVDAYNPSRLAAAVVMDT